LHKSETNDQNEEDTELGGHQIRISSGEIARIKKILSQLRVHML